MQKKKGASRISNVLASRVKRIVSNSASLPIAVGGAVLATTLILWQALLVQQQTDIKQATRLEAANAKYEITRQLQERTQALERMAQRWETQGKPSREYWEADAKLYVKHYGGFQAIEWLDSSFQVRWVIPLQGNEAAQNINHGFEPRRKMALEAARNQNQIRATRTINLKQGGKGFLVYLPIAQQDEFEGFIVGIFRTREFLDMIFNQLDQRVGRKYALVLFDGNEEIYRRSLGNEFNKTQWEQETTLTFNGVTWQMKVWPEPELLAEYHSPLPSVILMAGTSMAFLLPLAIHLAQLAQQRTKKLGVVNQKLHDEIFQRQQAEEALRLHAQIMDLANDTIMIRTLDNCITYWNQGATQLYGWTEAEVQGKPIHNLLQTVFPKPLQAIQDELLSQGYWQGELRHTKRNGEQVTVASRWTLQYDEQGQPSAILEINNNISDVYDELRLRNRAEQRLKAQHITAQILAESADLSQAAPKILQALSHTLGWDVGELWQVNSQTQVLDFVTAWYQPSVKASEFAAVTHNITFARGTGLPGRVWDKGQPLWTSDVAQDVHFLRAAVAETAGLHGAFAFPILNSQDVLGVITCFSREIRQPDTELLDMVTAIGRQIGQFVERKQAEKALEQQRQWLEVTLSSIGDAVIATDTATAITFMNPVAEALTGWTLQEALGRKIDQVFCIIHEYTRAAAEIPVERALREGVVVELAEDTALIARDGREIPIDDSCASIRDSKGTVQGAVLIFRDVSKRKQTQKALRIAEAKYRNIFENAVDGIFQTTPEGHYLNVNPALLHLYGYKSLEDLTTNLTNLGRQLYVDPNRRAEFQRLIEQNNTVFEFESEVYRQDGSIIWISENARVVRDSKGAVLYYEGIVEDITQRKLAEAEIRNALEKEKELNILKSRFVSLTSHEFRIPLTTILGSAELLEYYSHKWTEEKKQIHLHRIQRNVKHLTHLLDDVLLIGKADVGRLDFNPKLINVEQFCLGLVEELQPSVSTEHTLKFVYQGECSDAYMDERLLRHIFNNLLANAIKYSPAGGTVYFTLTCQEREAIFQIQDQGIGIPQDDQKCLFETFHRASNVGEIQGSGLGLAIVKRSVDLHGGTITVHSEIGVGTTFTVTLPLKAG